MSDDRVEVLVEKAKAGDRLALEEIVGRIQQPIYSLAVRMLWDPEDARDATQESLIRIVTRLESFHGESRFTTWAYRVAANHLLNCRQSRVEMQRYSFERFGAELDEGLSDVPVETEWPADHRHFARGGQSRMHAGDADLPRSRISACVRARRHS